MKKYKLKMTGDELLTLRNITMNVGGSPTTSRRRDTQELYRLICPVTIHLESNTTRGDVTFKNMRLFSMTLFSRT